MLTGYRYCGLLATQQEIEASTITEEKKRTAYNYDGTDNYRLGPTGDGVYFYITTQWMRESFKSFLAVVETLGYQVYLKR